mmetsp:Transcript_25017/g.36751  ORF Transcript_25017/g.36751 Transcript_25017/m.36751 type:complete len:162 (+) Transcript_25017:154-639(+)|eukprot:CAMPEP_0195523222 /NCGR_PEP_ID=MMETSP0794_2-20130614/22140_1 /TAXON_ID=515487 /ORGANISM="Stephanopyxis turris, Strain CCMP 815" /LENGTH=161 /DNA_ID=CAMNT_0040653155 /DNA_START=146 /DNA_END=631 /DNA_ORIENTATION=+
MSVNEVKRKFAVNEFEVRGTGHPGSRTFVIGNEDHTLGNALRHVLAQNAQVEFSGYSVPHPSEPVMHLRIQTAKPKKAADEDDNTEQQISAHESLKEACDTLSDQCDFFLEVLEDLIPEVKNDRLKIERFYEKEAEEAQNEEEGDYADRDEEMYGDEEEEY